MADNGMKHGARVGAGGRAGADDLIIVDRGAGLVKVEAVATRLLYVVLSLAVVCARDLVEQIEL